MFRTRSCGGVTINLVNVLVIEGIEFDLKNYDFSIELALLVRAGTDNQCEMSAVILKAPSSITESEGSVWAFPLYIERASLSHADRNIHYRFGGRAASA